MMTALKEIDAVILMVAVILTVATDVLSRSDSGHVLEGDV